MLTSPARLCRPCRLAGPAHAAATAGFSIQEGEIPRDTDSPLEGDGFELSVPCERGYRPELSSVIYVPETVRVLPNKYTVATALAALVELYQNAKLVALPPEAAVIR